MLCFVKAWHQWTSPLSFDITSVVLASTHSQNGRPFAHDIFRCIFVNGKFCSKTCFATVLIRSISAWEKFNQRYTVARHVLLKSRICFLHKQENREKCWWMSNSKHKVLTGNPTGNSRHDWASSALNMGYFDQSARSIERRCVVIYLDSNFTEVCS